MISYIIPTRNRPRRLRRTLEQLARLGPHEHCGGAEVIIADNDSDERLVVPERLSSGVPLRMLTLEHNEGAAARNTAAKAADPRSRWLVMLDDDSWPVDAGFFACLDDYGPSVAAVSADIFLDRPGVRRLPRESGGLPEVFIGCGVAMRREVFDGLGGYDAAFHFYVEEYDLAARMMLAGFRIAFDPRFMVLHAKDAQSRDMNLIVQRLVRNNGWVAGRYAPGGERARELREVRTRYRRIARNENAMAGFGRGLLELRRTLRGQQRSPLSLGQWERFTGLAAARHALSMHHAAQPFRRAALVDEGKNAWVVARALAEMGVQRVNEHDHPEVLVIATMSPGPMLDALLTRSSARHPVAERVLLPWLLPEAPAAAASRPAAA